MAPFAELSMELCLAELYKEPGFNFSGCSNSRGRQMSWESTQSH